jgi:hypothetical protein
VRIRIVKRPRGTIDGVSLRHYRLGETYDVAAMLAQYLVAEGFARFEMRTAERSRRPRPEGRRKTDSALPGRGKRRGPVSMIA